MEKKIVIAGAGSIGLYLAIQFVQRGIAPKNILILDPRLGKYTRPGHLDHEIFLTIIGRIPALQTELTLDKQKHIKDLERMLYRQAEILGIDMRQGSFVEVDLERGIVSFKQKQTEQGSALADEVMVQVHCEFLFDATGPKRVVLNAVNERAQIEGKNIIFKEIFLKENPSKQQKMASVS